MIETEPTIDVLLRELHRAHDRIDALESELRNYEQELRTHKHSYHSPGLPQNISQYTNPPLETLV